MSSGDVLDVIIRLSNLQKFVAGTREAAASVKEVGAAADESNASSMAGVAGLATKAAGATAAIAAGIAYESTKMAASFQSQMEMIHTQAGASQAEVAKQSANILGMANSGNYAQGPQELAQGLFHLESIGLRGAKALNALKVASQGAAVGNANLEDTTTALGSAWLVNIKGAGSLRQVMGLMNATVGAGNLKMQALVQSLGTGILPAAKLAHISIQQVMGALAVLSDEGWQGSSAMAQLATSLHYLTDPSTKALGALQQLHLTQQKLSNSMAGPGGLLGTLKLVKSRLDQLPRAQQEQVLGDIFPAGRGRVLETLMNQTDRYGMKLRQITGNQSKFGQDVQATSKTASFQWHAALSSIQADMIRLGHLLLPLATDFAKWTADAAKGLTELPSLVSNIGNAFNGNNKYLKIFSGLATSTFNSVKGDVISVWHAAVQAFDGIKTAWDQVFGSSAGGGRGNSIMAALVNLGKVASTVIKGMAAAFSWLIKNNLPIFVSAVKGAMYIVKGVIQIVAGVLTLNFGQAWDGVKNIFSGAVNICKSLLMQLELPFKALVDLIKLGLDPALSAIGGIISSVASTIQGVFVSAINNGIIGPLNTLINFLRSFHIHVGSISLPIVGKVFGGADIAPFSGLSPISPIGGGGGGSGGGGTPHSAAGHNPGAAPRAQFHPNAVTANRVPVTNFRPNLTTIVKVDRKEIARASGKFVDDRLARR